MKEKIGFYGSLLFSVLVLLLLVDVILGVAGNSMACRPAIKKCCWAVFYYGSFRWSRGVILMMIWRVSCNKGGFDPALF